MFEINTVLSLELNINTLKIVASNQERLKDMEFKTFFDENLSPIKLGAFAEKYSYDIILELIKGGDKKLVYHLKNSPFCYNFIRTQIKEDSAILMIEKRMFSGVNDNKIDYLSGIYTRSYLFANIKNCIQKDETKDFYFIIIDLNNFKKINDVYGHRIGDEALRAFSQKLLAIKEDNLLGRYGGDEFIIFCANKSMNYVIELSKKILDCNFTLNVNSKEVLVSCCCGVTYSNDKNVSIEYLLENADKSLYLAKENGKNLVYVDKVCVYKSKLKPLKAIAKKNQSSKLFNDELRGMMYRYIAVVSCVLIAIFVITMIFKSYSFGINILMILMFTGFIVTFRLDYKHKKQYLLEKGIDNRTGGLTYSRFKIDANTLIKSNRNYALVYVYCSNYKFLFHGEEEKRNQLLKDIFDVIKTSLTEYELVTRIYIDRFAFLISEDFARQSRVTSILKRINKEIYEKYSESVDAKAGVYVCNDKNYKDVEYAVDMARLALRSETETLGAGGIVYYGEEMLKIGIEKQALENKVKLALKNREFAVYYQVKRDILNDRWDSCEALVRWEDPVEGLIYPDKFIPTFEQSGTIVDLDIYVFKEVCRYLDMVYKENKKALPVSVNVSQKNLANVDFLNVYKKILDKYDFPRNLIVFELKEIIMLENEQPIHKVIEGIHKLGCGCSVDDFGIGYSSLSLVTKYDFDEIKLDRTFFKSENSSNEKVRIVIKSVVELCRKLNIKIVAEGVEDIEILNYLKSIGCNLVQGYVYSRAVTLDEYNKLIQNDKIN